MRAGCTFADFDGYRTLLAGFDARVSLVQCTFAGNTLFPEDFGAAVIEAETFFGSPQVTLEGCTISKNTPSTLPTLLADNREGDVGDEALFYSDSPSPSVCTYEGMTHYQLHHRVLTAAHWHLRSSLLTYGRSLHLCWRR